LSDHAADVIPGTAESCPLVPPTPPPLREATPEEFREVCPWWPAAAPPPARREVTYDCTLLPGEAVRFLIRRIPGTPAAVCYAAFPTGCRLRAVRVTDGAMHRSKAAADYVVLAANQPHWVFDPEYSQYHSIDSLMERAAHSSTDPAVGKRFDVVRPGLPFWVDFVAQAAAADARAKERWAGRQKVLAAVMAAVRSRGDSTPAGRPRVFTGAAGSGDLNDPRNGRAAGGRPAALTLRGMREAVEFFRAAHPEYGTPDGARFQCGWAVDRFAHLLQAAGVIGRAGSPPAPGGEADPADWDTIELPGVGNVAHRGLRVGRTVFDWTARQFDPAADWPRVWDLPPA
jgi:hypothetical protein